VNPGGCGATLSQITDFKKKSANGRNDGGHYSAREFTLNRYMTLYSCPRACMYPIRQQKNCKLRSLRRGNQEFDRHVR
jgi:hypothetical protein